MFQITNFSLTASESKTSVHSSSVKRTTDIRVSAGPTSTSQSVSELILETADQKQVFWYGTTLDKEDEVAELEWVGDLDGDNRLDLLFRYYELNGGGSVDVLLLSSHAKRKAILSAQRHFLSHAIAVHTEAKPQTASNDGRRACIASRPIPCRLAGRKSRGCYRRPAFTERRKFD